jgi:Flp pilus assembly protein TadG
MWRQNDKLSHGPSKRVGLREATLRPIRRRGAAIVELALLVPLLLLLAFACVDFGRIMHAFVTVTNAARCGAAYGAMHKYTGYTRTFWEAEVRQAIEDEMAGLEGFDAQKLQTTVVTTTDDDELFRVDVDVAYPFETAVAWPGVPRQVQMRRRVEMRQVR